MNRGSRGAGAKPAPPTNCFNEAPIHESGKSLTLTDDGVDEAPLQ